MCFSITVNYNIHTCKQWINIYAIFNSIKNCQFNMFYVILKYEHNFKSLVL